MHVNMNVNMHVNMNERAFHCLNKFASHTKSGNAGFENCKLFTVQYKYFLIQNIEIQQTRKKFSIFSFAILSILHFLRKKPNVISLDELLRTHPNI
jgi:hypothetical protein